MVKIIENNIEGIIALCKTHKVLAISLFGSAARNAASAKSDLDFLVQFSEDILPIEYSDNYFSFSDSLELLLGKKIDLISLKSLKNQVLKEEIYKSKIDLYAA